MLSVHPSHGLGQVLARQWQLARQCIFRISMEIIVSYYEKKRGRSVNRTAQV
jgi:hypothetical protein